MKLCLRSIVRMTRSQARGRVSARAAPKEKPGTSTSALGVNRAKADKIRAQLQELYPNPPIPLVHRNVFELLCAVVLSAQCTDKKVNSVTGSLFEAAPDPEAMAELGEEKIKEKIKSLGLANNKAKFLVGLASKLVSDHGGEVPSTMPELEALPGVGHKTASVVMSQAFGVPAFPVDTHIHRLAARWGLSSGKSVKIVEQDLKAIYPPESWRDLHLQIIFYGREHGKAGNPPFRGPICSWAAVDDPPPTTPAKKKKQEEKLKKRGESAKDEDKPKKSRRKLL